MMPASHAMLRGPVQRHHGMRVFDEPADRLNEAVISRFFRIESYAALSRPLSRPPTSKRAAVSSCPIPLKKSVLK
jgi:hypothetical protein